LKIAFDSGANQITGGSIAIKNRALFEKWIQEYGSENYTWCTPTMKSSHIRVVGRIR
jgi:hypothetical protein